MPGLRSDEIASIQASLNSFMQDTGVNSRTTLTTQLRVNMDTREVHIPPMPSYMRLRRWRLTMPAGTDVKQADRITVPVKGVYTVVSTTAPESYSFDVVAFAVQLVAGAGGLLPVDSNNRVEFRNPDNNSVNGRVTVDVWIYPARMDAMEYQGALDYDWAVMMPLDVAYPDGTKVNSDDEIRWSRLGIRGGDVTKVVGASITKPIKHMDLLPFQTSYFKEPAV